MSIEFSRQTIISAVGTIDHWDHDEVDRFLLEHGLEEAISKRGSVVARGNALIRYLLDNPEAVTDSGESTVGTVVRDLVERAIAASRTSAFDLDYVLTERFPKLIRALGVDGFAIKDGQLMRTMPVELGLSVTDDEVHELLKRFGFTTTLYHLDQSLQTYNAGGFGSANGQIRTFIESLINEIAERLVPDGETLPAPGGARLTWLAKRNPPFVMGNLREWDGQGGGYLEAFIGRLQPKGPHPGIPEEQDCTFRLHTALVVARLLLCRLADRL